MSVREPHAEGGLLAGEVAAAAGAAEARCAVQRLELHLLRSHGGRHRVRDRRIRGVARDPRRRRCPTACSAGSMGHRCRRRSEPRAERCRGTAFAESFEIAGRPIGAGASCYVIAEAGANHNRDLGIARELIDVAAAPAPTRSSSRSTRGDRCTRPRRRASSTSRTSARTSPCTSCSRTIALPREWHGRAWSSTRASRGIEFFATPFDADAVDELSRGRRPRVQDRVVRDRRPRARGRDCGDGPAADHLDRHGDLRRDRRCAGRRRAAPAEPRGRPAAVRVALSGAAARS